MNMQKVIYRFFVFFIIFIFISHIIACTKRVSVPMDPNKLERERLLHVKLISGKEVKVKKPKFENGFLLGKTPLYDTRPGPEKDVKIPVNQIESITVERYSRQKTIITIAFITLTFGMFYIFFAQFEDGFN